MHNNDGIIMTETTSEDSRTYLHAFYFPTLSEQATVKAESKRGTPKLKVILKNHRTTIPTVSPFDPWCDGEEVDDIDREDVLDTVRKPICATYRVLNAEKQALLNTPGGVFKNKGLPYAFHIHHLLNRMDPLLSSRAPSHYSLTLSLAAQVVPILLLSPEHQSNHW
jgi:hypothetical protein